MKVGPTKIINSGIMAATIATAIAAGTFAARIGNPPTDSIRSGDFSAHIKSQPHPLTLYGTTTCGACINARAFLKRSGIPFNDLVLEGSPEARKMYRKIGSEKVPIFLSSQTLIVGFSEQEYLNLAKTTEKPD